MDYDRASLHYRALLSEYLQATPADAVDQAVARFVAPLRSAFVDERAGESVIEGMLWAAWEPVVLAARESSDSTQGRLVDLLTGVQGQGTLTRDQGRQACTVWGLTVFADLPCLGAQMREQWDTGATEPEAWVNINAFAARLTAAGIDFSLYAIWTLCERLEETPTPGSADLRAAVPWFQHCGDLLVRLALERRSFDRGLGRLGKLCTDRGMTQGGFTVERWEFWRGRLSELAAGTGPDAAAARVALRCLATPGGIG